jgi:hypothetical protein
VPRSTKLDSVVQSVDFAETGTVAFWKDDPLADSILDKTKYRLTSILETYSISTSLLRDVPVSSLLVVGGAAALPIGDSVIGASAAEICLDGGLGNMVPVDCQGQLRRHGVLLGPAFLRRAPGQNISPSPLPFVFPRVFADGNQSLCDLPFC